MWWTRPKDLEALRDLVLSSNDHFHYIAGGTDLTPKIHREGLTGPLMDLTAVEEMGVIRNAPDGQWVGAAVPFSCLGGNLLLPAGLSRMARLVGSPQVRNRGTMGGNVGNLSPAADSLPILMALDAFMDVLSFQHETPSAVRKAMSGLCKGPSGVLQGPRDLITGFLIPPWEWSHFLKVGSRRTVTISKLNLACALDQSKGICRVYLGALAPLPIRCPQAEVAILELSRVELMKELPEVLSAAVEAAIPGRASMPYKREAIKGLGMELAEALGAQRGW